MILLRRPMTPRIVAACADNKPKTVSASQIAASTQSSSASASRALAATALVACSASCSAAALRAMILASRAGSTVSSRDASCPSASPSVRRISPSCSASCFEKTIVVWSRRVAVTPLASASLLRAVRAAADAEVEDAVGGEEEEEGVSSANGWGCGVIRSPPPSFC